MFKALATPGGDATKVAPIDKLSMPIAVILAFFFLKEKTHNLYWLGVAMMVAGAILAGKKF
jgi:transporter family protein